MLRRFLRGSSSQGSQKKQAKEKEKAKYNLPRIAEVRPCEWPYDEFLREAGIYEDFYSLIKNAGLTDFLQKKSSTSSNPSSSSSCYHFWSPCSKFNSQNCLGDCSLVYDSSNGPISFCSSALFIANFCCLGDPVLELACQIYVVKSSFNAWYGL